MATEQFQEVGVIDCPKCGLASLSWNMNCARCGADLMPDEDNDDSLRHKQVNSA